MKTSCFDAAIEFSSPCGEGSPDALISVANSVVSASLRIYEGYAGTEYTFAQVRTTQPVTLKWKDAFTLKNPQDGETLGEGVVLDPVAGRIIRSQIKRRVRYLKELLGSEKEMLMAVIRFQGIRGVQEKEIFRFGHFSRSSLLELGQELETEGLIRILEFSPLFFVSQSAISFLCEKVSIYLERYHEKYPNETGVAKEKILKRFDVHPRILTLALKYLIHDKLIKEKEDLVSLYSFEMTLLPEEKKILEQMEEMYLKNKFSSVSLDDLQKKFRLSSKVLHKLLSLLTERKKVVLGKDGFIIHSRWIDEVIQQIRDSGKRELTVSEFKEITGLTRKFAIPLLELLDRMGITKRRGSSRDIL